MAVITDVANKLYRGRGKAYLADRLSNGQPDGLIEIGGTTEINVTQTVQKIEHFDYRKSPALKDGELPISESASLTAVLDSFITANFELACFGVTTPTAAGTVAAGSPLTITSAVKLGYAYKLGKIQVSTVVVKAGATATAAAAATALTLGVDYELDDAQGLIKILSGGTVTAGQVIVASYTYADQQRTAAFKKLIVEKYLLVAVTNDADLGLPVQFDFYKVRIDPAATLALIGNTFGSLSFSGEILQDLLQPSSSDGGQFYARTILKEV